MLNTRRTTLLHLLGLSAASLARPENHSVQGSPVVMDLPAPPKEIKGTIHGREFRLKYSSLKSQQQAALYCHLWFLHLSYGLVIDQPFLADENGMELTFAGAAGLSRTHRVKAMARGHEVTEDTQAFLVLLSSVILAAVTQGDGFTAPPRDGRGENAARNWFSPSGSATSFDERRLAICLSVLQVWSGREASSLSEQMRLLEDRQWMAATSRYGRMKVIIDWLLLQKPTTQELRSSPVVKSMIQTLLDMGRYHYCWMEHFADFRSAKTARQITGNIPTRNRCRLLTTAFAFKCLFPSRKLPSIQFAINQSTSPLDIVLEGVGSTFVSFNATLFSDGKLTTTDRGRQNSSDTTLTEYFSVGEEVWDYPLYALVALLGLGASGGRRKQFVELTSCKEGASLDQVVPFGAVLVTGDHPDIRAGFDEVNISVTDWDGFEKWTEFKP